MTYQQLNYEEDDLQAKKRTKTMYTVWIESTNDYGALEIASCTLDLTLTGQLAAHDLNMQN